MLDNSSVAITIERLRVLPDFRMARSFVDKIHQKMFTVTEVGERRRLEQFRGLSPDTAAQVDSALAMFKELAEVRAGKRPNTRFIL